MKNSAMYNKSFGRIKTGLPEEVFNKPNQFGETIIIPKSKDFFTQHYDNVNGAFEQN